jgi:hypothetical protein
MLVGSIAVAFAQPANIPPSEQFDIERFKFLIEQKKAEIVAAKAEVTSLNADLANAKQKIKLLNAAADKKIGVVPNAPMPHDEDPTGEFKGRCDTCLDVAADLRSSGVKSCKDFVVTSDCVRLALGTNAISDPQPQVFKRGR